VLRDLHPTSLCRGIEGRVKRPPFVFSVKFSFTATSSILLPQKAKRGEKFEKTPNRLRALQVRRLKTAFLLFPKSFLE